MFLCNLMEQNRADQCVCSLEPSSLFAGPLGSQCIFLAVVSKAIVANQQLLCQVLEYFRVLKKTIPDTVALFALSVF